MITVKQAAEILKVIPRRVRQLIATGQVEAQKFGRDWAIDRVSVENRVIVQQAQKAWVILGISSRLWGAWWLSDVDEIEQFDCPQCEGQAYSPAGGTKYSDWSACPGCGWSEKKDL